MSEGGNIEKFQAPGESFPLDSLAADAQKMGEKPCTVVIGTNTGVHVIYGKGYTVAGRLRGVRIETSFRPIGTFALPEHAFSVGAPGEIRARIVNSLEKAHDTFAMGAPYIFHDAAHGPEVIR